MESSPLRPRPSGHADSAPLPHSDGSPFHTPPSISPALRAALAGAARAGPPPPPPPPPPLPGPPFGGPGLRAGARKRGGLHLYLLFALVLGLAGELVARQRHALFAGVRAEGGLGDGGSGLATPLDPVEAAVASAAGPPGGGVAAARAEYARTRARDDWRGVVEYFLRDVPVDAFRASAIEQHYADNVNNAQGTCLLARISDGAVTFTERYGRAHGRAESVRYMLRRIARRKRHVLRNLTVLVMLSDGHRPRVPTLGSARHWTNWNLMIPAPIGNARGHYQGWGSPLERWDEYVATHVSSTHKDYPWRSKIGKAVFRGALAMQTYKLGSCNEKNGRECERATRWDQVNRGVLYKVSRQRLDLFDVGFSQLKPKLSMPPSQFDGAPKKATPLDFRDFQKYKFVINVGSNQDWSERLRLLLFMNSAVIYHMAETQEFFSPLLKPWTHYIPANLSLQDLPANVEWAIRHDAQVRQIVQNQNDFAKRYISERAMETYWEVVLEEFAARQGVDP